jgi:hypothetical protein
MPSTTNMPEQFRVGLASHNHKPSFYRAKNIPSDLYCIPLATLPLSVAAGSAMGGTPFPFPLRGTSSEGISIRFTSNWAKFTAFSSSSSSDT